VQTTCGCRSCHDVDVCTQDRVDHLCSVKDAQSLDEHRSRATHSAAVGKKGQSAEDAEDDYDSGSFFGPRKSTADDVERAERNRERALDGQRAARAQRTVSQLMGRLDRIEKRFTAGKAQSLLEKIIEGADKVEEEDAKAHPIVMAYQAAVKAAAYVPPEHRAEYMMRYVIAALHGESEAPELPFPGRQPPSLRSKLTKSINIAPERATKHYPWPNKYEVIETPASREQYVPDGPEATNLMALRDEMAELIALTRANKNAGVASLLINGPPKVRLRSVPLLPEPTSSVREIAEIAERSMSILISPKSRRLEMRARGRMSEARGRMKTLKKQLRNIDEHHHDDAAEVKERALRQEELQQEQAKLRHYERALSRHEKDRALKQANSRSPASVLMRWLSNRPAAGVRRTVSRAKHAAAAAGHVASEAVLDAGDVMEEEREKLLSSQAMSGIAHHAKHIAAAVTDIPDDPLYATVQGVQTGATRVVANLLDVGEDLVLGESDLIRDTGAVQAAIGRAVASAGGYASSAFQPKSDSEPGFQVSLPALPRVRRASPSEVSDDSDDRRGVGGGDEWLPHGGGGEAGDDSRPRSRSPRSSGEQQPTLPPSAPSSRSSSSASSRSSASGQEPEAQAEEADGHKGAVLVAMREMRRLSNAGLSVEEVVMNLRDLGSQSV